MKTALLVIVAGLAFGLTACTATAADPAPAKTVIVTKTVETGAPEVCVDVAKELQDMLLTETSDVVQPLISSSQTVVQYALGNGGIDELNAATGKIKGANDTLADLKARTDALKDDYAECVG